MIKYFSNNKDYLDFMIESELRVLTDELINVLTYQQATCSKDSPNLGIWAPAFVVMHMWHFANWKQCPLRQGDIDTINARIWMFLGDGKYHPSIEQKRQNRMYFECWKLQRRKELQRVLLQRINHKL